MHIAGNCASLKNSHKSKKVLYPAFTGQSAGLILMKLHLSGQYHPYLSASFNQMAIKACPDFAG
jgi:hypothetical protein